MICGKDIGLQTYPAARWLVAQGRQSTKSFDAVARRRTPA
jgi:hypothetical protein